MGIINVLDKNVAELIAAGEVVERPASIVKELVENSLDADADKITVEIRGGGIKYIRISDNGCGISREDIPKAFLRNATSKIKTADDLEKIFTFGFRGEALASIAAMCEVELTTRTKDEKIGSKFVIKGSERGEIFDIGCPVGTTIIIRNVFFNTPARLKFLKRDGYEASNAISVLEKLAMINSNVSFKAIKDGTVVLNTPGNSDLKSSIHSIMGSDFADNLIETDYCENGLGVYGFITKPTSSKATRASENFYINNRFVKSKTCRAALEEAYKSSMMVGKFPGCVINLQIPADIIDVNVHPAKTEVRFSDEKMIYDLVFSACRMAIKKDNENNTIRIGEPKQKYIINDFTLNDFDYSDKQITMDDLVKDSQPTPNQAKPKEYVFNSSVRKINYNQNDEGNNFIEKEEKPQAKSEAIQKLLDKVQKSDFSKANPTTEAATEKTDKPESFLPSKVEYRIVGELFATYILVEKGNSMFLIDKHAAHERYIYNKIIKDEKVYAQFLVLPIKVKTLPNYYALAKEKTNVFSDLGFDLTFTSDNIVEINSIPSVLNIAEVNNCFNEICEKIFNSDEAQVELIEDLYHSIACRSAVKANDFTPETDLKKLVDLVIGDIDLSYCPHGRPIITEITKNEIERKFFRIV